MNREQLMDLYSKVLNKFCKWKIVFASWQLGTRTDTDAECAAVKDHREVTMLLRVEYNALTKLLVNKGLCTEEELAEAVIDEALHLDKAYEAFFPGFSTTDHGLNIDPKKANETAKRMHWRE